MTKPAPIILLAGSHRAGEHKYCWTEAIAYAAGQPHSSSPKCLSPVIRRFGMTLNDGLDDEPRQLLRPFALRALGTANDGRDEERREMCAQWLLGHLPDLFDSAGLEDTAQNLRAVSGDLAVENVRRVLWEARDQAYIARDAAMERLRERVHAELAKRGAVKAEEAAAVQEAAAAEAAVVVAAAVAAAAAVQAAVVEAVVVAAAAVVAVAAVAAVVEAVVEAAEAVAEEAAVVEAVDAAVVVAVEAPYSERYWRIRQAVYPVVRKKVDEILAPTQLLPSALELLDRMLPPEPLQAPAIPNAEILFAAPEKAA